MRKPLIRSHHVKRSNILAFIEGGQLRDQVKRIISTCVVAGDTTNIAVLMNRTKPKVAIFQNKYKNGECYKKFMPRIIERFPGVIYLLLTNDHQDDLKEAFSWGFSDVVGKNKFSTDLKRALRNL